jgi:hypothetical protein
MKFGGIDPAQRVDNTCFTMLTRHPDGSLEESGLKIWPHIKFQEIASDLEKIQSIEKMSMVGFDRTGIGDLAQQLMPKSIPLLPVVTSAPMKVAIINFMNAMFSKKMLRLHSRELYDEVLAQQRIISSAGNVLYRHEPGQHDDRLWSLGYACVAAYSQYFANLATAASKPVMDRHGNRSFGAKQGFDMKFNF